jgi:hypothetical protein
LNEIHATDLRNEAETEGLSAAMCHEMNEVTWAESYQGTVTLDGIVYPPWHRLRLSLT